MMSISKIDAELAYFVYGANMSLSHLHGLGVQILRAERAILKGWQLCFNVIDREQLGSGFANIQPNCNAQVEGVLYRVTASSIVGLDEYEDYPHDYDKAWIQVKTWEGVVVDCFVYVGRDDRLAKDLLPTDQYRQLLIEAQPFLSAEYYQKLENLRTHCISAGWHNHSFSK